MPSLEIDTKDRYYSDSCAFAEAEEKIERILADCPDWFDTSFCENVQEQMDDRGYITEKQIQALDNAYDMLDERDWN